VKLLESFATALIGTELKESGLPPLLGLETGIDSDDHLFRRLSQSSKDLPRYQHERTQSIAFWLYISNPLAYRLTELTKDFTIGKGISFVAEDERVKEVLDSHWDDPVNNWDIKQHYRILELGLYGEVFNPVFVSDDGSVRLGCLDPLNVQHVITDPENIEVPLQVKMKSKGGQEGKGFEVVRHNAEGVLEGEIIISQLKRVSNMTRGLPDLASVLDWIDKFDDLMFGELERVSLMRAWIEDITIDGADANDIEDFRKLHGKTPKWGTRWVHNEKVSRDFLSPKIESADLAGFVKLILAIILAGAGVPEHYMILAYDINKATALTMDPPLIRRIETRQRFVRGYFKSIFDYVITQAALKGKRTEKGVLSESDLKKKETFNYQIIFPSISQKDIKDTAQAIVQLTNALVVAETQQWVTQDKAREVFAVLAEEFGVDIDSDEQKEEMEKQEITESYGIYAYRELKDFIDWFKDENGNGELRETVRKAVIEEGKHKKKKRKEYA